ncbi:MAG: hypothetical protein ACREOZ_05135, partial [Gloeomargaritales cyanobacterium]
MLAILTYWILSENEQIIARSCVRPIDDDVRENQRAKKKIPGIPKANEDRNWTKTETYDSNEACEEDNVDASPDERMLGEIENAEYDYGTMKEDIENVYEDILNAEDHHDEQIMKLDHIVTHRYAGRGGNIELNVQWMNGELTWEKMSLFRSNYPMAIAEYARKHKLYKSRGFKWIPKFIKEQQMLAKATIKSCIATVRKSKRVMRELRTSGKRYQYGVELPRSVSHALELDSQNNNHRWRDAIAKEMTAMEDNNVFKILDEGAPPPTGYTKIPLIMIFTVKPDGAYKARLVAGGHVTSPPET